MTEDGMVIKIQSNDVKANIHMLDNSIVVKVFGHSIPFFDISIELRRQWSHLGAFHLTNLRIDWMLCSFDYNYIKEGVLSGGPWFVVGHIICMEE